MNRISALLITMLLLLPVTALAAAPNTVYVGGVELVGSPDNIVYATTNGNGEVITEGATADNYNIKWDGSTLTLHDATIQKELNDSNLFISGSAIGVLNQNGNAELTIQLEGSNTIEKTNKGLSTGIHVRSSGGNAALNIKGDGTLVVNSNQQTIQVISIEGNAALSIENAKVTATSSNINVVTVQSSSSETSSASLTVNGGSLTATTQSNGNSGIRLRFGTGGTSNGTPTVTVSNNAIVRANGSAGGITSDSSTGVQYGTGSSTTGGIVFDGTKGTVYGNVELQENLEIGEGESLTIGNGASLNTNGKLTNDGTINVESGGKLEGDAGGNGTVIDGSSPVSYLDENGTEQSCTNYKMVTANDTQWTDGWYVVRGNISGYTDVITVTGDVHLILENNCDLNFNSGSSNLGRGNIWVDKGGSLTIYAQSTDENIMGKLTMYSPVCAGIEVSLNANLIINGGKINATGGDQSAGIGHSQAFAAGTITINGGVVTADGGIENGPGIDGTITINGGVVTATGGNENGHGLAGIITINGGVVIATGGSSTGFGIGMPYGGDSFSTGTNGNAFIIASSIQDQSGKGSWSGVIFEGDAGAVYGSPTLQTDATIPAGKTLTIESGKTLTIGEGVTLTVEEGATLANNGKIINYGTINGKVTGKVAIPLTENMITVADATYTYTGVAVTPDVTVEKDGVAYIKDTDYTVEYSDNINAGTAKVTVEPKEGSLLLGDAVTKEFTIAKAEAPEDGKIGPAEGTDKEIHIYSDQSTFSLSVVADVESVGKWVWEVTEGTDVAEITNVEAQQLKAAGNESEGNKSKATFKVLGTGTAKITATYKNNNYYEDYKVEFSVSVSTPPVVVTYHDLHITESTGAKLVSRYDKKRTPDGGSFTLSLEKEEGYEDCEPTVYYKRGRFGEWKELKIDEVSGYYQIRSVYSDIYVKVSGDGIWPVSNEEVEALEVKVYAQNGAIVVSTPSLMEVQIISMTGSVVAADKVAGWREFRNLAEGIYVVRVGEEIVKVRL